MVLGLLTWPTYTLLPNVVLSFFNSMSLLEFSIFDHHDCMYWLFNLNTTWKLLLMPERSNQMFMKSCWVKQWYTPCNQLWFSIQTVSKARFDNALAVFWTVRLYTDDRLHAASPQQAQLLSWHSMWRNDMDPTFTLLVLYEGKSRSRGSQGTSNRKLLPSFFA